MVGGQDSAAALPLVAAGPIGELAPPLQNKAMEKVVKVAEVQAVQGQPRIVLRLTSSLMVRRLAVPLDGNWPMVGIPGRNKYIAIQSTPHCGNSKKKSVQKFHSLKKT